MYVSYVVPHVENTKMNRGASVFGELGVAGELLSRFGRVRLYATPIDGSPPGFPIPGILQARTLEWVAISFSNA